MATYYVSTDGSDNYSGLSDASAWQTIAKVNATTFQPGDSILFNRGDEWREQLVPYSGSAVGYVTYSAYGTGNKPKLLGSVTANSGWSDQGSNIWQNSNAAFTVDVGNLIFNAEESCGVKQMSATPTLDTQGDFWYDFVNNRIRMYSVGNPATFYTNIEAVLKIVIIDINAKSYVIFENLDLRYGNYGITGYTTHNIIIRSCDISYIGGADMNDDYSARYGNAIELYGNAHDNIVEKCRIDNVYDAGITSQGYENGNSIYNLYFRTNIISNCEYGYEFFHRTGATVSEVRFENNTIVNSGGGFGHNQRPDGANGASVRIGLFNATKGANIYIRNNILYEGTERIFATYNLATLTGIGIDYNLYYQSTGAIGYNNYDDISYNTLADWKTYMSQESHAISGNPLFVSSSNFHLQTGSPAINVGVNVGLTTDYEGNPLVGLPDIGAYEYSGTTYTNAFMMFNNQYMMYQGSYVVVS